MDRNIYNITRVADGQNYYQSFDTRVFKGAIDIYLNLNFIKSAFEVVKMRIAVSGEDPIWYEDGEMPAAHKISFVPPTQDYSQRKWILITAIYNNFNAAEFFIPIYVAKASYYTDFDGLKIKQAQFIDSSSNGDVYVVFESNQNLYNMLLRANPVTLPAAAVAEVNILAAVSAVSAVVNPIATDADENVEVVS